MPTLIARQAAQSRPEGEKTKGAVRARADRRIRINMGPGGEGWGPALVEPLMPVDAGM